MKAIKVQQGGKNQLYITIPREIADRFGIKKGTEVFVIDDENSIRILKAELVKEAVKEAVIKIIG